MQAYPDPGLLMTIRDVRVETDDARTFELDVPASERQAYKGRAGQFVRVMIPGDPTSLCRNYSLSNSPELNEPLRFTVKRIVGGLVSERLVSEVGSGQTLHVAPPAGNFTLKESDLPLLLIAGGSGVTPVFSLLKAALHTTDREIALLYANRNRPSAIFLEAIDNFANAFPQRLSVRHHFSDEEGFPTEADIRGFVSAHPQGHIYICGPEPLMEIVDSILDASLSQYELITEKFLSPKPIDNAVEAADPASQAVDITLRIDGREFAFAWTGTGTLLDAALAADVPAPFSCRKGHCGACKARLVEGNVEQRGALALSKRDLARNNILACCSTPQTSTIVLEYD